MTAQSEMQRFELARFVVERCCDVLRRSFGFRRRCVRGFHVCASSPANGDVPSMSLDGTLDLDR
jgi:hypothetical protein